MPDTTKDKKSRKINISGLAVIVTSFAVLALVAMLILNAKTHDPELLSSRGDVGFVALKDYNCVEIQDFDAPVGIKKEYTLSFWE